MRSLSRMLIVVLALALVVPALLIRQAPAAEDVKIALVAPLSGRWARQGQLKKMGADMAIEEINSQGGINLLVEQRVVEALELCDRGYILETGRVGLAGARDALADARGQRAYLGA